MRDLTLEGRRTSGAVKGLGAFVGAWLVAWGVAFSGEEPGVLRAGVAKVDITPAKPVTMSGYGSRKDLSQGVHDPLSARVVALERDGERLVLVSTDLIGFYGGTGTSMRNAIIEACGLRPPEIFLAALHTHGGPTITLGGQDAHPNNVEYTKTLESKLVAAVREALAHLVPVEIAVGTGSSPVGANRREFVQDETGKTTVRLGRNPSVLTHRKVHVLRVSRAETGDPMAVVFAYATHSTAMGPGNYLITGDVHGLAEQFLENHLKGGIIAPAFAGASGDIDPWFRVLPKFNTTDGWIPEPILMGTMLGQEVVHVLDRVRKPAATGPIETAFTTIALPAKRRAETGAATAGDSKEFNITAGRVGDVAIVGLGGEVFNEIGRAIEAASPFPHTIVITHTNGAAGYLPIKEAYPEGGYEVETSPFGPAAAEEVIEEARRLLETIR